MIMKMLSPMLLTVAALSVGTASANTCINAGSLCTEPDTPDNCCEGMYCKQYSVYWSSCLQGTAPPPPLVTNTLSLRMTVQEDNLDQIRIITESNLEVPQCLYEPGVDGEITLIPGPWSSQMNKLESNSGLFMWQEKSGVVLPGDLKVDVLKTYDHTNDCEVYEAQDVDYTVSQWCGTSWAEASDKCNASCMQTGYDQECIDQLGPGSKCFGQISNCGRFNRKLQVPPPDFSDTLVADGKRKFNSYIIHGDTLTGISGTYQGFIRFFGQTIVAVQYTKDGLDITDGLFGMSDTIYPTKPGAVGSTGRGFELGGNGNGDFFTICRNKFITLQGQTCPETAASACTQTVNLGYNVGPSSGNNAFGEDYPITDPLASMSSPFGRDDSIAFLTLQSYHSFRAAEVEGKMVIGRDLIIKPDGANSLVQAGHGSGIIPNVGEDIMIVGGNIKVERDVSVMETGTPGGNIIYAGTYEDFGTDGLRLGFGGQRINKPNLDMAPYIEIMENVLLKSEYWASLSPNGVFLPYTEGPNDNTILFKAGQDNACVQIFHVDQKDLGNLAYGVNVQFDASLAGKTILINVAADPTTGLAKISHLSNFIDPFGNGGFDFTSKTTASIMWNFYDATHVELGNDEISNGQFRGTVIVPKGSLRMTMPGQSGRMLVAADIMHDFVGSEFHNYKFDPVCELPDPPTFPIPQECQTPAPYAMAPDTETGAPTMAPTPYQCPEDIELLMQVGNTTWTSADLPIIIIEQNTTSVTFRIKQEWAEELSFMYILFDQEITSDEICYTHADIPPEATFTYTAMCTHESKVAMVEIWTADDSFLVGTDNAVVPECCHSPDDDTFPKVQYCFELHCVTQCPDAEPVEGRRLRGFN